MPVPEGVIFDAEDKDLVDRFDWRLEGNQIITIHVGIAVNKYLKSPTVRLNLAREIYKRAYGDPGQLRILRHNGDYLDVRSANLHCPKHKKPKSPKIAVPRTRKDPNKFLGVYYCPNLKKKPYRAFFPLTKKSLGYFRTAGEAAKAVNKEMEAYMEQRGEKVQPFLNKVEKLTEAFTGFDVKEYVESIPGLFDGTLKTMKEFKALNPDFGDVLKKLLNRHRQGIPVGISFNKKDKWGNFSNYFELRENVLDFTTDELEESYKDGFVISLSTFRIDDEGDYIEDKIKILDRRTFTEAVEVANALIPYTLGIDFPLNKPKDFRKEFQTFLEWDKEAI